MNITSYTKHGHKPCYVLQWPNSRILLDTPIDYTPFFSFMPHVYQSPRFKNAHIVKKFGIRYIKELSHRVYIDGPPEIFHVSTEMLKMDRIDAILVSNYENFIGLPFYTENTGFSGKIYATEIAFQYGKLLMEEMLEFMERIEARPDDATWKKEEICQKFPNAPSMNPMTWTSFYKAADMHRCLTKVITLSFNQTIELFRVKVTPIVSGHTYGSANWIFETENEKIGYLTASNPISTDVKPMEIGPLRSDIDYLIINSMSRLIDTSTQAMGVSLTRTVTDYLKNHGSVILPICPVGPIFEMIEAISDIISSTTGISPDTPIYLISPVAKSAIAMANISAEWMSESRQKAVYLPEEPYYHSQFIKSGRLRIYESLYGNFSKEFKTPCVILASHPSLRVGDAAHMIEVLGSDPKNAVIITDSDLPCEEVREPFRNLPIKFINIPMDFRMDFATLDKNLQEWKPKVVICPSAYSQPVLNRPDLKITYENLWPIKFNETVKLWKMTRDQTKTVTVSVHPDVVRDLRFKQHPTKKLAIASVACNLSAYNDDFKLVPSNYPVIKQKYGKVTLVKLLRELRKRNLDPHEETTENQKTTVLNIPILQAKITMSNGGKRMKIQSNDPTARWELQEMFNDFLMEDDGIVGRPTRDVRDVDAKEADK